MAKKSLIAREHKRESLVKRLYAKRKQLKEIIWRLESSHEDRESAQAKLQKLPNNSSPVRLRTRCQLCGRPRAVYKKFGLCRIHLREALMTGGVPGGRMASW